MVPPLLERHHEEWFAYTCANHGLEKLTGATLNDAAAVCTQVNGTGFTEEVASLANGSNAFDLAVARIARAVLDQANLQGKHPQRGEGRNVLVVDGEAVKCNKLEATAIIASDGLTRPINELYGETLDGENTWQTEKDGEEWVRATFSPDSAKYMAAQRASFMAAQSLKPTAIFHINAFVAKNKSSSVTFPLSAVSEICIKGEGEVVIETDEEASSEIARQRGPSNIEIGIDWPPTVRVRSAAGEPIALSVL